MTKERVGKTEKTQPNQRPVTLILKQVQDDKGKGRKDRKNTTKPKTCHPDTETSSG